MRFTVQGVHFVSEILIASGWTKESCWPLTATLVCVPEIRLQVAGPCWSTFILQIFISTIISIWVNFFIWQFLANRVWIGRYVIVLHTWNLRTRMPSTPRWLLMTRCLEEDKLRWVVDELSMAGDMLICVQVTAFSFSSLSALILYLWKAAKCNIFHKEIVCSFTDAI